jgi:hypothetical protein
MKFPADNSSSKDTKNIIFYSEKRFL